MHPVALITGASRGIGAATAIKLAQQGFRLALLARNEADLQSVAAATQLAPEDCLLLPADLTLPEAIQQAATKALQHYGSIAVLINNAGIGHFGPLETLHWTQFQQQLQVNVLGSWVITQALLPSMKKQGHGIVLNVLSDAAKRVFSGGSAYCASKFAQAGMFGALRHEVDANQIKICNIYPGLVNSYFNNKTPGPADPRKLQPEDVANAIWQIIANGGSPLELDLHPNALNSN